MRNDETISSDTDYDIDSTNEFFVAGWDPYVVGLTGAPVHQADPDEETSELEQL